MAIELAELRAVVEEVGAALLRWRAEVLGTGSWDGGQMKTEVDGRAHRLMSELLSKVDPAMPVVSEESSVSQTHERPPRYFLIDPIDGTASYVNGFAGYVTQVALMEGSQPTLAAIHAPSLGETFCAQLGGGATLNGAPLAASGPRNQLRLIDNYPEARGFAVKAMEALGCTGYVESGSISLKVCRLADQSAEVFVKDVPVRDWDLAAPHLVLKETGGALASLDGRPVPYGGSYEHTGLIATYDPSQIAPIAKALLSAQEDPET
jgi:3'(2'), 5'-bisphosphate nucleotidase